MQLNLHAGAQFITGDNAKFQQIIWNLLKNAIKFTHDDGEITDRIKQSAAGQPSHNRER